MRPPGPRVDQAPATITSRRPATQSTVAGKGALWALIS